MVNSNNNRKQRGGPFNLTSPGTAFTIGFITLAIGMAVLLSRGVTPGNMLSDPGPQGQSQIITEAPGPGQNNLQLKTIKFITSTPTPTSAVCNHDNGKTNDPSCNCAQASIKCENKVCVQEFKSGFIPNPYQDCQQDPNHAKYDGWCQNPRLAPENGIYCLGKPVIYLYPQKPTFVTVTLQIPGEVTESIPEFEGLNTSEKSLGGWQNVLALPGGILKYQNSYYHELYYESAVKDVVAPDSGIFLDSSNLKQELIIQGEKLGLLPNESIEFANYWLPRLQSLNKKYIFFSILTPQEKEKTDKVIISPTPDNFIEFIAYFKGVDEKFEAKPFVYPKVPHRTGFTAVEWGGTIGY